MSKLRAIAGVLKTFLQMSKEDFSEMDHRLLRIGTGIVGFIVMAIFWYVFFSGSSPLKLFG
jgi:hypothetical protein